MIEQKLCFYCLLDDEYLTKPFLVIKGVYYTDSGWRHDSTQFLGHGGRVFKYRILSSGEVRTTNNLWCAGGVNVFVRDEALDNAEFVND